MTTTSTPATQHDFTAMFELYHQAIFRYCMWKCRDRDVAEDLAQETFMRFEMCLQRDQKILNARAFLYRIAHNLFINHARRKKETSLDQLLEVGFEPATDPWQGTNDRMEAARMMKKLEKMEEPVKQVLHRRFIQGLAPAEIATMTGESANTVSVRIFRGLKHLRGLLDEVPSASLTSLVTT